MHHRSSEAIHAEDFFLEQIELEKPRDGEVLTRTRWFSLDPYLANSMRSWRGGDSRWQAGVVVGRTIGEVIESSDPRFQSGDQVLGFGGWQALEVRPAAELQRIHGNGVPVQAHLGALGSSGLTAWVGVKRILQPEPGETAVVSSAAGLVGAIAGQILRSLGCRVVGIAGGGDKCAVVVGDYGFDACIDHTAADFEAALADATPDGIDVHYENVGTKTLDPVLARMRDHGRIALCGLIAHYQDDRPIALRHFRELLMRGITLQGFRIADHSADYATARNELRDWLQAEKLVVRETVTAGLERAPQAYVDMLRGAGIGKHLVRLD